MINIELKNFDKLIEMAEKYPQISERYIGNAIQRSLVRIFAEEKKQAPFGVTARLRDDWELKVGRFEGYLKSRAPYALGVHEGTPPHYVAPSEIKAWAEKRGINPYAVAHSIAKKGTMPNPFFQRAVDLTEDSVNKEFDVALDSIIKEMIAV